MREMPLFILMTGSLHHTMGIDILTRLKAG
jgi:hypothetical protein